MHAHLARVVEAEHEDAHLALHKHAVDDPAGELRDETLLLERVLELAVVAELARAATVHHLRINVHLLRWRHRVALAANSDKCGAAIDASAVEPLALAAAVKIWGTPS